MRLPRPDPDALTDTEQDQFARYLRERLPEFAQKNPPLYVLTEYAARVLKRPALLHWRGISRAEAKAVMQAARAEYPQRRPQ